MMHLVILPFGYFQVDATVAFLTTQLAEGILAEPHFPESKLRIQIGRAHV